MDLQGLAAYLDTGEALKFCLEQIFGSAFLQSLLLCQSLGRVILLPTVSILKTQFIY